MTMDGSAAKSAARAAIAEDEAALRALSLEIHGRPELNFEEVQAHDALSMALEERGFAVERGAYGLATAFAARMGVGGPTIAICCEYDALPEIGHACGHNLIAMAGVGAALGLGAALRPDEGQILVLGTPAEEGGGGKVELIERGALAGVDAAMMVHPALEDSVRPGINALHALEIEFRGRNAHAAAAPWDGINALDAMVLAYNGVSVLRQQLPPDARVHGVITDGGGKPNIIPKRTRAEFLVRAGDETSLAALKPRVLACFEAAATATGCLLEAGWSGHPYSHLTTNGPMAEAYVANAGALGKALDAGAAGFVGGSTDMGNVSHVVPTIHPMFAIEAEAGNHTAAFAAGAARPGAQEAALLAATAMAMTGVDLCADADLLARAQADFRAAHD